MHHQGLDRAIASIYFTTAVIYLPRAGIQFVFVSIYLGVAGVIKSFSVLNKTKLLIGKGGKCIFFL